MHGLQEGHRDLNRPGNLHQNKKHYTEMCGAFLFYLPFTLTTSFVKKSVCRSPQAVTNAFYFTVRPSAF